MTIKTREIIEAVSVVAENNNIRVTVKGSMKAAGTVAATTFLGSILMGPLGIFVGAAAGSIFSYNQSKGKYKSAVEILQYEMTPVQQARFCEHIKEAFRESGPQDFALLVPLIASNGAFQQIVLAKLIEFLTNEMQMQIVD